MLRRITATEPRFGIGIADRGLYIDMAREARDAIPGAEIELICGRDAAERIATWDYGEPGVFERMLDEFRLLVAPRSGQYPRLDRVHELPLTEESQAMSATEVRTRIRRGEEWQHLVPAEIRDLVAKVYS
jgi:nicotinic acid mononucleotide adenylyltransferase